MTRPMQSTSPVALRGLRVLRSIIEARRTLDTDSVEPPADRDSREPRDGGFANTAQSLYNQFSLAGPEPQQTDALASLFELNFEDLASLQLPSDFTNSTWPLYDHT